MPLVTILTPTYNRERLVGRAIDSVLVQTLTDWELIIIDDGSTDNTKAVIDSYMAKDDRIKYLHIENSGQCNARNEGFKISSGTYITYLDSDDEYMPEKIAAQVEVFQQSTVENLGVVTCGKRDYRDGKYQSTWLPFLRGNILDELLRKRYTIGATTSFLMVKREVLESGVSWSPGLPSVVDFDFLIQICTRYGFDHVAKPLVRMNHHSGERMFTNKGASKAYDIIYEKYRSLITKKPHVHQGFLNKYLFMKYRNQDVEEARQIFNRHYPKNSLSALLWKSVLAGKVHSPRSFKFRAVNRLVKKLSV